MKRFFLRLCITITLIGTFLLVVDSIYDLIVRIDFIHNLIDFGHPKSVFIKDLIKDIIVVCVAIVSFVSCIFSIIFFYKWDSTIKENENPVKKSRQEKKKQDKILQLKAKIEKLKNEDDD